MKKQILLGLMLVVMMIGNVFAATYYASPTGGGAASCVDNGANVCTLQRAVTVAATGTHTIECATGNYSITTALSFDSTNTGANITIQPATGATVTLASTGGTAVVSIASSMVSGDITFDDIDISDTNADSSILNASSQVNVVYKNGSITNTDTTAGHGIRFNENTTDQIQLLVTADTTTGLRTAATTNVKIAQQITVGGSNLSVDRVALYLTKNGTGIDYRDNETLTVTIETNNVSEPSGTPIANGTSANIKAYDVNANGQWTYFDLPAKATLSASTVYWIVLSGTTTADSTSNISWSADSSSGGYAGGDSATYDGTNWTGSAAGFDYMFCVMQKHSRNLTVQDSTFSTRNTCVYSIGVNNVTVDGNTLTSTAASMVGLLGTSAGTLAFNRAEIIDNAFTSTTNATQAIIAGISNYLGYGNVLIIKDNTGTINELSVISTLVKKVFIYGNVLELQYNGSVPLQLGYEVNGVDPIGTNNYPFEQIVIEKNEFTYSATSHNHIMLFGIGSENGVLVNNLIKAPNGLGDGGGGWGIIVKADEWYISGNRYYGPGPAIYITSNHNIVTHNTLETYNASGSYPAIMFRNHQDSIYGGYFGIPYFNFVEDNIFISNGSALSGFRHCDTNTCGSGASTLGTGRTSPYWSNRIDNNIYWARDDSTIHELGAGTNKEDTTAVEGISTVRTAWESATYSDSSGISQYNDINNSWIGNPEGISGVNYDFISHSINVKEKGTMTNSNIGEDQDNETVSGMSGKWQGSFR